MACRAAGIKRPSYCGAALLPLITWFASCYPLSYPFLRVIIYLLQQRDDAAEMRKSRSKLLFSFALFPVARLKLG